MKKIALYIFSTEGKIGRDEFWSFHIATYLILFIITFALRIFNIPTESIKFPMLILVMVMLWGYVSIYAKRLHDLGKPGSWALYLFIPVMNIWVFFKCGFAKGVKPIEQENA